ncbi:alcohol dehydrogenase catalytic domain-containing protein [Caballeronia sp. ATUFL_M1_KS5A]|uniref:alcohol dehydrogenase catalytic domain-containing protein n=1 Tax=Caballeronia sp. ATUFL_M1_KS5A TaxID=2921778 RepID=UPI002027954C|nr:alcohol dehydrogenase catalytic domain-containing protein [Caballeronia sp. ATUFL_M1_KS5A]
MHTPTPAHDAPPPSWPAWTFTGSDDPRALALNRIDAPPLERGHVLVRNVAIGLNPVDWKVLGGDLVDWQLGKVPGVDGAGVVVAVGGDVERGWLGKRVAYHTSLATPGSFAHYTPVAARALLMVPPEINLATAASMPCPALTAWLALDKLPTRAGARVLISGAGGAVGHYALQLAVLRGFDVSVMCHPRHWDRLRALGARMCFEGPLDDASLWSHDHAGEFFAVIDSVSGSHAARLAPSLRASGHLVCIQGRADTWRCAPFGRTLSLHEVALGALHLHGDDRDWARLVDAGEQILGLVASGRFIAEEILSAPFDALPQQLDALRHRAFSGKPVVSIE